MRLKVLILIFSSTLLLAQAVKKVPTTQLNSSPQIIAKPKITYIFKDFTIFSNYSFGFGSAKEMISNLNDFKRYEYNLYNANQVQLGAQLNDYLIYLSYAGATVLDNTKDIKNDVKQGVDYGSISLGMGANNFTLPFVGDIVGFAYLLPYIGIESGLSYVLKATNKTYLGWKNTVDLGTILKFYFTDSLEFKAVVSSTKTYWSLGEIKAIDVTDSSIFRFGVTYRYRVGDLLW